MEPRPEFPSLMERCHEIFAHSFFLSKPLVVLTKFAEFGVPKKCYHIYLNLISVKCREIYFYVDTYDMVDFRKWNLFRNSFL